MEKFFIELATGYANLADLAFAPSESVMRLIQDRGVTTKVEVVPSMCIREVVEDKINGRLLMHEDKEAFVDVLVWVKHLSASARVKIKKACRLTAKRFEMSTVTSKVLDLYIALSVRQGFIRRDIKESSWKKTLRILKTQAGLVKNLTKAATYSLLPASQT